MGVGRVEVVIVKESDRLSKGLVLVIAGGASEDLPLPPPLFPFFTKFLKVGNNCFDCCCSWFCLRA